jgi:hypothetical protein
VGVFVWYGADLRESIRLKMLVGDCALAQRSDRPSYSSNTKLPSKKVSVFWQTRGHGDRNYHLRVQLGIRSRLGHSRRLKPLKQLILTSVQT